MIFENEQNEEQRQQRTEYEESEDSSTLEYDDNFEYTIEDDYNTEGSEEQDSQESEEGYEQEEEDSIGDDDEEDDDDEDDSEEEKHEKKIRVDYSLQFSQSNRFKGETNKIMKLSFTACCRHIWIPDLIDYEGDDPKNEENQQGIDFYSIFEKSGTGGVYSGTKSEETSVPDAFRFPKTNHPRIAKAKNRKALRVLDQVYCRVCSTYHRFRIELSWNNLFTCLESLRSLVKDESSISPPVLYRHGAILDHPADELFRFVSATRLLAFLMIISSGSSGYGVSPVDFLFTHLLAEGLPIISGIKSVDYFAEYETDGSLDVD